MVSFLALFRGPDTDLVPDFSPGSLRGLGNALPHIFLSAESEVIAFELDITPSACLQIGFMQVQTTNYLMPR